MKVRMRRHVVSETNAASLGWIVKIAQSGRQYRFYAGDTVVIGRTPLRPSALADGDRRLDVDDPGKSMSKRHALLLLAKDGSAAIRDLHSTNGTYVVRSGGELMRLPLDQDYAITTTPLHLQLGDVAVTIQREVSPAGSGALRTPAPAKENDLFSHAAPAIPEGVDSPSLSVDQILDVRAGEPTEMFNAQQVRKQVLGGTQSESGQGNHNAAAASLDSESDFAKMKQDLENQSQLQREFLERGAAGEASRTEPSRTESSRVAAPTAGQVPGERSPQVREQESAQVRSDAHNASVPEEFGAAHAEQMTAHQQPGNENETPAAAHATSFEPGSVFDRLTSGNFDSAKPAVEIGDLNSNDAQRTDDQSLQFEMAKHHELLPFLALNPHLYDDLYAWLEAIGDSAISSALRNNAGYVAYQEGRK
jgi:hypothetical protein